MTHENMSPPPLPISDTKPKRKWRVLKVLIGVAAAIFLVSNLLAIVGGPRLEVSLKGAWLADDRKLVEIMNTGAKPVVIKNIVVNDRADCTVRTTAQQFDATGRLSSGVKADPKNDQFQGGTFQVGDKVSYVSSCQVIRVSVETDQGTGSYSFR